MQSFMAMRKVREKSGFVQSWKPFGVHRSAGQRNRHRGCKQAMEPLFTTKPEEERSGMGFSFMEAFMDRLEVESAAGEGTVVKMWKEIGAPAPHYE